jgi:hypothetical protein
MIPQSAEQRVTGPDGAPPSSGRLHPEVRRPDRADAAPRTQALYDFSGLSPISSLAGRANAGLLECISSSVLLRQGGPFSIGKMTGSRSECEGSTRTCRRLSAPRRIARSSDRYGGAGAHSDDVRP